jgi:hypothetical protein
VWHILKAFVHIHEAFSSSFMHDVGAADKGYCSIFSGDVHLLFAMNTKDCDTSLWVISVLDQIKPSPEAQDTSFYLNLNFL